MNNFDALSLDDTTAKESILKDLIDDFSMVEVNPPFDDSTIEDSTIEAKPTVELSNPKHDTLPKRSTKTLLILDLNGVLVERIHMSQTNGGKNCRASVKIGNFLVWIRPGVNQFFEMIFHNFDVAVWSSTSPQNIGKLIDAVFGKWKEKLVFVWDQTKCERVDNIDPQAKYNDLFLKNLKEVFSEYQGVYDETNTIIVDDNILKMRNNPEKCYIITKPWTRNQHNGRFDIGNGIMRQLAYYLLFPSSR